MALPPQMDEPTPMRVLIFPSICSSLWRAKATSSDVAMVQTMMGKDCFPVSSTTLRFRPKPSSTTAVWRIFLEVKPTPGLQAAPGVQNRAMTIPMTMENTGPPMTGTSLPSSHEGTAMARHTAMPERYFLMVCILRYHSFLLKAQSFPYYSEWYSFRQAV